MSHAALPENQSDALREYVQSRLSTSSPSSTEFIDLMNKSIDETNRPIEILKTSIKAMNLQINKNTLSLQNKVLADWDPFKNPVYTKWITELAQQECCAHLKSTRPKDPGE